MVNADDMGGPFGTECFGGDDNEIIRPRHAADVFGQPQTRERMHAIPPPANDEQTSRDLQRFGVLPGAYPTPEDIERAEWQRRKERPLARGMLHYFPDACMEVAHVSFVSNEQHNPGQPMHWAFGKSMDHQDCELRHMCDPRKIDTDKLRHKAKKAWRALADLQTELENEDPELHALRQAQRDAAAKGHLP